MSQYRSTTRTFSTRQERMWRRNQNTTSFAPSISLGPIAHTVLIVLMVAILGLIYLTQVTKTSSYGYEIDKRQKTLTALQDTKRDLEVENARLQALSRVTESSVASAMQAPASTERVQN
jgi:hypothetical protein